MKEYYMQHKTEFFFNFLYEILIKFKADNVDFKSGLL